MPSGFDSASQRPGDYAAYVEEGQTSLVLLVCFGGFTDHARVERDERVGVGNGRDDDRGGRGGGPQAIPPLRAEIVEIRQEFKD